MNTRIVSKLRTIMLLISGAFALSATAGLFPVTNKPGSPANTFECSLTSTQQNVTIGTNNNVQAIIYKDTGPIAAAVVTTNGIPVPMITLNVGDLVICHFTNNLPPGNLASIHWHGIELDNDSDGTGVTQSAIRPGESYDYKFQISRPGVFWFHNHELPADTTFAGMYGVIIVPNTGEQTLVSNGTLPAATNTFTLAMSDIDFNPANGYVGKFYGGTNSHFGTNVWLNINSLVEMCHLNRIGDTNGSVTGCTLAGSPGATVLVNGAAPNPGGINSSFTVHSGQKVRLRLLNEAMSRDFRMTLLYPNNRPTGNTNIYRIGGQGGLLDNMRLEGGTNNGGTLTTNGWWDTQYGRGEIVIGSGERSDVIIYPTATNNGDVIRLVGNPLPAPFNLSGPDQNNVTPITNNYPIAYFTIIGVNDGNTNTPPTNGAPILPTGQTNESYRAAATNPLMIPPAPYAGTSNPVITLGNGTPVNTTNTPANNPVVYARGNPNVDGYSAMLDSNLGGGSWTNIVRAPSTLYARVGDMLELSVANSAGGPIHPFHLHGFSLQPLRLVNGATTYTYPYNEFVDTIEVYPGETLVFRVRLDDRPKFCDSGAGGPVLLPCTAGSGAVGRWLFHCHIFLHAGAGMMGEVDVLPLQQTNYVQLPDLTTNGVDVLATTNTGSRTVADDFRCLTNGLITGISIWGSWLNDLVDSNSRFELKLWTDVPAAGGNPSRPGWQAWRQFFPAGTYTATLVSSNTVQPFYDPSTSLLGTNSRVYRYDFVIPPELAFNQQSNTIYWLSVSAYSANRFGWHSCLISANFNDAAEWSTSLFGPNWSALLGTNGLNQAQPINASFLLTSPGNSSALLLSGSSITVPPAVLSVDMVDGKLNISWTGAGTLQSAEDIAGPWTDVNGATSPYLIPFDKPQSFYRVKMP